MINKLGLSFGQLSAFEVALVDIIGCGLDSKDGSECKDRFSKNEQGIRD